MLQVLGIFSPVGRQSYGLLILLFLLGGVSSCVISQHSGALQNATVLKGDTLALMSKATEPYDTHKIEVSDLDQRLEQALDLERSRPGNEPTTKMWETLLHTSAELPGSGVYLRFKQQWQSKGTLKPVYIENKKRNVAAIFDSIISLERAKPR